MISAGCLKMKSLDSDGQRYFQFQEKLKAIGRIKAGESQFAVAHSLGITGETLCEWISSLAPTDWSQGAKSEGADNDLLDRALYSWFIQQLGMDLRPTMDSIKKKADIFSVRLYGDLCRVSDWWLDKWKKRHNIKEKPADVENGCQELNPCLVDDVVQLLSPIQTKESAKLVLECDFDLNAAIEEVLNRERIALEKSYKEVKICVDKLEKEQKSLDDEYERLSRFPTDFRVQLLNTFGRDYGLFSQEATVNGKKVNPTALSEFLNEVVHIGQKSLERQNLPPFGPIERKKICPGMDVFALKADLLGVWLKSTVVEIINGNSGNLYRVKFKVSKKRIPVVRVLSGKHIAYCTQPPVTLPVGTRVIAHYKDEVSAQLSAMYAGIVSEPPKITNNQRYLIFFDDGYAQYVRHSEVFLVCEASTKEVWRDIHPDSQDFIKSYLERYPERPMVKLQKKQVVKVEWNLSWWNATVLKVDASLVHVYFEMDKRTEWLYRGSTRLAPLYNELMAAEENRLSGKVRRSFNNLKRKHQPYVEYTTGLEEPPDKMFEFDSDDPNRTQMARKHTKNTARKSTTLDAQTPQVLVLPQHKLISQEGMTVTDKLTISPQVDFKPHRCTCGCNVKEDLQQLKGQNPLRLPMLCGWLREIVKQRSKRVVCYKAPCGRRLRSLEDVLKFLQKTRSKLPIDLFCFDICVHTFSQFKPSRILAYIKDITYGKEPVPVCLVNSLNRDYPKPVAYSSKRFPGKGVVLNTDPEFLCGCDCEDDCEDRAKCQCQQLTIKATAGCYFGKVDPDAGYDFRRLMDPLFTGVYECNSRCKCRSSCLNRVVQNGLQVRLQVFKTEQKGWGIRCLDDLPQGIFICIYAGQLSTEEGAQDDGREYGDEYQAELDHIEVVESRKEGYESDVEDVEAAEDSVQEANEEEPSDHESTTLSRAVPSRNPDSDSDYEPSCLLNMPESNGMQRRQVRQTSRDSDDTSNVNTETLTKSTKTYYKEKSPSNGASEAVEDKPKPVFKDFTMEPYKCNGVVEDEKKEKAEVKSIDLKVGGISSDVVSRKKSSAVNGNSELSELSDSRDTKAHKPLRSFFGEEYCYIMDAKNCGNIGRYLNHSCNPNVFVQNVFVDSHDLRFPWVAFFASIYIRAGTELTWDYHYDVGSVPGKVLHCYCGAKECRRRLL